MINKLEMMEMAKPRILVSECINLAPVRYNGGIIKNEFAEKLYQFVDIIPVCPEVAIGLGVPRPRIILVKEDSKLTCYQPDTKRDLTNKINTFSSDFIKKLPEIDGALLKSKSPSCGVSKAAVYKDNEGKKLIEKSKGIFARHLIEKHDNIPIEDEGRLLDNGIREHFLERIFALAHLRSLKENSSKMKDLVVFHSVYKYFLMSYNQKALLELGNIIANREKNPFADVLNKYINLFKQAIKRKSTKGNNVNVIYHIIGYLSDKITSSEKKHFEHLVELYKNDKIDKRVIVELLKHLSYRFDIDYIKNQTYLNPYPEELMS